MRRSPGIASTGNEEDPEDDSKLGAPLLGGSEFLADPGSIQRAWWSRKGRSLGLPTILGQLFLIASLAFLLTYKWSSVFSSEINTALSIVPDAGSVDVDTLVIYIFSPTDPEYERNMRFFIEHGMSANDPCHYAIIVQQTGRDLQQELPVLPSNAWYEFHENRCFDWGTVGWALRSGKVDITGYKYFIIMNSSVRGPFTPAYYSDKHHWSRIFTDRITDEVKLVGPTISCEGAPMEGDASKQWRTNPHVQSYVTATDQTGMAILQGSGSVFSCYETLHDTIYFSELGSSAVILEAGYNIASLMLRYQGIDWRDKENWACNERFSPYAEHHYDGLSLDPLEVVFVKVKSYLLDLQWQAPMRAVKFDSWMTAKKAGLLQGAEISSNEWVANADKFRLPKMLGLQALGSSCFDWQKYLHHNKDLAAFPPPVLFQHFVFNGQFEGRQYRFLPDCLLASVQLHVSHLVHQLFVV
ncbi:hypothetical protein WJX74_000759 [Apatococcus lobatus]|uniref:Uncharacterized protein n=1 Tax=Apatococcus lobatus TaxID=904363 RepID=A0AAW1S4K4_9CHLO